MLHYSGHGEESYLSFEDGSGASHELTPQLLASTCAAALGPPAANFCAGTTAAAVTSPTTAIAVACQIVLLSLQVSSPLRAHKQSTQSRSLSTIARQAHCIPLQRKAFAAAL